MIARWSGLNDAHIGDQLRKHIRLVERAALAVPVEQAQRALADELVQPRPRQGSQMRIGKMREPEHPSGAAYQDSGKKDQRAPDHDLECG